MKEKSQRYGIYALYLTCFFCTISSSLTSVFSVLMLLCWFISGTYKNFIQIVRESPVSILGIIFCSLLLTGVFYSPADLEESLDFFKKYRVLLYIPIILSLTKGVKGVGKNIVNALMLGYVVVLLNAFLVDFGIMEPNRLSLLRRGGGFMVIFAYLAVQRAIYDKKYRWAWLGFFLAISYDFFYILISRTGIITFAALVVLFMVQYLSFKKQLVLFTAALALGIGIVTTSQTVQGLIEKTTTNLAAYNPEALDSRTSLGVRLDWYQNSMDLIKKKPIFGHGTGSFGAVQKTVTQGKDTMWNNDPHNEFLLTGVHIGLVGVFVLLLLLAEPVRRSFLLLSAGERERAFALQATMVYLIIGCIFNSWLLSSIPSHIFAFLMVVYYPYSQKNTMGMG